MSSDGDDWENQLDSDNEKEEESKKAKATNKFDDEDQVDPEKIAAQKKEEQRLAALEAQQNGRVKKANKIDYDKAFEERQAKLAGVPATVEKKAVDTKGLTAKQKGLLLEQEAEKGLADQLFGGAEGDADEKPSLTLNSEKEYKVYGQSVGKVLYSGAAPYRVENFFKELCKDLPSHCDSKQIKKIADHLQTVYNQKLAAEKEEQNGKNKKKKAPTIKGGGGKGYEMNNNVAMISDVMGAGDDNDDYGDYGDEGQGFKREDEAAYDFM